MGLREIMTYEIRECEWMDYCWERGDSEARSYKFYTQWLWSLTDNDFLAAYNRVRDTESKLD